MGNAMQRLALIAWIPVTCLMSQASATPLEPLDSQQGIAADLSFIETQVTKTLTSLGSPTSGYPVSGGDSGTWTTTSSVERKPGMDDRVFPGPTLAPLPGDGVAAVARGGTAMDCAFGLAGLSAPDRPHGHRLHHRDEFWQRIPTDRRPELQRRADNGGRLVGVVLQFKGRGGSLLDFWAVGVSGDRR